MGRPPAKPSGTPASSLDRGLLPSLLGYVLRRAQSAVFDDFAATFSAAGEALTPVGEKALARFARLVRSHEKRIASRLSANETRTLIDLLEKVHAGARSL